MGSYVIIAYADECPEETEVTLDVGISQIRQFCWI